MCETTYAVTGMTCDHCVRSVTEELGKLDGVAAVSADLATGQVRVTSDGPLADDSVRAAVAEAGYEVTE
jgi:copper chaperone